MPLNANYQYYLRPLINPVLRAVHAPAPEAL